MHTKTHKLKTGIAGLLAMLAIGLGVPAAAGAQAVTSDQYDDPVVKVETASGGQDDGGSGSLSDPVGPLPFTGFDVIAMLGVALAVTGLGLGLQRAVASRPTN